MITDNSCFKVVKSLELCENLPVQMWPMCGLRINTVYIKSLNTVNILRFPLIPTDFMTNVKCMQYLSCSYGSYGSQGYQQGGQVGVVVFS